MKFEGLSVHGAYRIEPDRLSDSRGFFGRIFCEQELAGIGVEFDLVQASVSFNVAKGTLRGMHFQDLNFAPEGKIVRCNRGSIQDVLLDTRPQSPTFGRWCSIELSADNQMSVLVPPGCAHGFLTLDDDTEILYMMSGVYDPAYQKGVRFNDPFFSVAWRIEPVVISDRDQNFPDFN